LTYILFSLPASRVRAAGLSVLYVLSAVVCGRDVLNNIKRLSIEKKDCGRRSILSIDLADGYVVDGVFPSGALTEDFHVRRGWDLHLANQNLDTAHCGSVAQKSLRRD
jgi:hypothetical protein